MGLGSVFCCRSLVLLLQGLISDKCFAETMQSSKENLRGSSLRTISQGSYPLCLPLENSVLRNLSASLVLLINRRALRWVDFLHPKDQIGIGLQSGGL
jgi:hypothetical protein